MPDYRFIMRGLLILVLAPLALGAPGKLASLEVPGALGVNIHFTDPKAGEMQMLADGGFKRVRMDFSWGGTERREGVYDFSAYDRLLAALKPHNVSAIFILDYANRLYDDGLSPHTDESRGAMANWAAAAVKHFSGQPVVWEMWNEPNIKQFWKPRPSAPEYAKLALAVGKSIRSADESAIHIGPATSTIDLAFLETCFKAGLLEYWDAVSVHPYRQGDPETVCDDYRKLRLLIARYAPSGKEIPIVSGEWGYSSAWSSFDENRQGKYLPREMLTNLYNQVPISIWYDWHDDGLDPKEGEHHFGTVHNAYQKDGSPVYDAKPAYVAMKALAAQLGGYRYNKRIALESDDDWLLLFSKGDEVRLAAWTRSMTPHDVKIPMSPGAVDVINSNGDPPVRLQADGQGLALRLSDSVQYLAPSASDQLLSAIAQWQRVPLEMAVHAPASVVVPGDGTGIKVKSGEPFHRYKVEPTDDPTPAFSRLAFDKFDVRQRTTIVITNPISFQILPILGDQLGVRINNPSGEAFSGVIMPDAFKGFEIPGKQSLAIQLQKGETSKEFFYTVANIGPRYQITLSVRHSDQGNRIGDEIKSGIAARFEPLDLSSPKRLKVRADGDAAVVSEQSLTLATPPEPLPHAKAAQFLKLSYHFNPGWKFLQVMPAAPDLLKIEGQPKLLGLWVYGDNSGHRLRLRFTDAAGQTFQPNGPRIDFKGWRYLTIPLGGADLHHWGKGDGQIHYPIQWQTLLLLDNESQQESSGAIWSGSAVLIY